MIPRVIVRGEATGDLNGILRLLTPFVAQDDLITYSIEGQKKNPASPPLAFSAKRFEAGSIRQS